jgi:hypothetical protein
VRAFGVWTLGRDVRKTEMPNYTAQVVSWKERQSNLCRKKKKYEYEYY